MKKSQKKLQGRLNREPQLCRSTVILKSRSSVSCILSLERDSSLEIKYRPKKTKEKEEKEPEPERDSKPDGDGSSTPQPRMDRRRGSQVGGGALVLTLQNSFYSAADSLTAFGATDHLTPFNFSCSLVFMR